MFNDRMIVVGEKESFLVRVLIGKTKDAGIECEFVPCTVDEVNQKLEGVKLITLYMDSTSIAQEEVLHFLSDNVEDRGQQIVLIAEPNDLPQIKSLIPEHLVYKVFPRPVDNAAYVKTITEYFEKEKNGEFKKSILIVDDDPNYLGLVREWLKDTYKVFMANSGLQAIKWLGRNTVDLILLDHEMPVTSGPQVLEMLRSDEETKSIPVMFLTGKSDKESVMKVVSLKPEKYLLKTMPPAELIANIDEFFEKQKVKNYLLD
jgi:CheY-like chemotaxis protein